MLFSMCWLPVSLTLKTSILQRSPNGRPVFWSRGVGWAFGAMARAHEALGNTTRSRDQAEYSSKLVALAKKLTTLQSADGCWRSSLEDADAFPSIETSGTSLHVFGLAYGVNAGLLNSEFGAAAAKGWACLNRPSPTGSVDAETGRLGYCQPGGASPQGNFNSSTTSDFCVGAFLLAGSEMAKLSQAASAQSGAWRGGTPSGIRV